MNNLKTSVISALVTAIALVSIQHYFKRREIARIKDELIVDWALEEMTESEEIMQEQLSRNIAFLGDEGVAKLRNAKVVVVGVGGKLELNQVSGVTLHICY